MKRQTTHTARITTDQSACSCRQWPGVSRRPDETIGDYTKRAWEAHARHVSETRGAPSDLFGTEPEKPDGSLF